MNQRDAFLEIQDPERGPRREPVSGTRLVVGRAPDADVVLESPMVSRYHLELFTDPFGRWWVRDLDSRNGTRVNGREVGEQPLGSADRVQVEPFVLQLRPSGARPHPASSTGVAVTFAEESGDEAIRGLEEVSAEKLDASHLSRLADFGGELLATEPDEERVAALCRLVTSQSFHGRQAVVLRIPRGEGRVQPEPLCAPEPSENGPSGAMPYLSQTLLKTVQKREQPVVASNAGAATGVIELSMADRAHGVTALACPLRVNDESMDVLYAVYEAGSGTGQWLALAELAARQFQEAEAAWEARRQARRQAAIEHELHHARRIQQNLIPRDVAIPGLDVAVGFEPTRWVGGDYTDVRRGANGRVLAAIGDVCGKGLQAALITASLHTLFHTGLDGELPLARAVERVDAYLHASLPEWSFVTMIFLCIDPESGELECVNCGHPPAVRVAADGTASRLQHEANAPLGIAPDALEAESARLAPGEGLALYTDGLSEMPGRETGVLGIKGVEGMIRDVCAHASDAAARRDRLQAALDDHLGDRIAPDDRCFLLLRRIGLGDPAAQ